MTTLIKCSLVWFRNDLRLHDHEPLVSAIKASSGNVLPIYCFDPRHFGETHRFRFPRTGLHRARFLVESLHDLKKNLNDRGSELIVRVGEPEKILVELQAELQKANPQISIGQLFGHKEIASEEVGVEKRVTKSLGTIGAETKYIWGATTMFHIEDLPFDLYSKDLEVFTKFRVHIENKNTLPVRTALQSPSKGAMKSLKDMGLDSLDPGKIPTVDELMLLGGHQGLAKEWRENYLPKLQTKKAAISNAANNLEQAAESSGKAEVQNADLELNEDAFSYRGGESEAIRRVNHFLWEKRLIDTYKETRNGLLGMDYSSKFSPWLSMGNVSPRWLFHEIKKYERTVNENQSTYWMFFELLWRDYFRWVTVKHGNKIFHLEGMKPYNKYDKKVWGEDRKTFDAWAQGRTGYSFIDANMIEMNATGFMSNRGRQNVASFLTKDLHLDWRLGAEYFEYQLIDHDVYSNYGNWTYVAGVGNDPREDRYFNIIKQGLVYDADGAYVSHWIPMLKKLPSTDFKHRPFLMDSSQQAKYGVIVGDNFPRPMVQLSAPSGMGKPGGKGGKTYDKQKRGDFKMKRNHQRN